MINQTFCKCGKLATYSLDDRTPAEKACDDCVPRNCFSCSHRLKDGIEEKDPLVYLDEDGGLVIESLHDESDYELMTDEQGRPLPCADWAPHHD